MMICVVINFNPRSREGSDQALCRYSTAFFYFNPRSREGSDGYCPVLGRKPNKFQSALPRGERPSRSTGLCVILRFQSALPRGERRFSLGFTIIYALFQSALPRGERQEVHGFVCCGIDFNPRSREGSDHDHKAAKFPQPISIRAPARGATISVYLSIRWGSNFNPRSREGSDFDPKVCKFCLMQFQSALPRGERPLLGALPSWANLFQSALPRGERQHLLFQAFYFIEFQSALPRGERRVQQQISCSAGDFNPRSREGSDLPCCDTGHPK